MPHNFSFVIPGQLAGMARPGTVLPLEADLDRIKREGIDAVVSLTEQGLPAERLEKAGLEWLHLPVPDFSPPTPEQIDRFVAWTREQIARGKAVATHCTAGFGRTGTMLACYLVALGESPEEAIESIRRIRPDSIETPQQEESVRAYAARMEHGQEEEDRDA